MSNLNNEFISIILPVFNGKNTIDVCLNSLINLDYPKENYEIIVVDNGSTDGTAELIRKYPVTLLRAHKKGSYAARNVGAKYSNRSILFFTDADCIVEKDWIKKMMIGFENQSVGCVVGEILSYDGETLLEKYATKNKFLSQTYTLRSVIPYGQTANVGFRKDVFDKIGYFDENMISGGDADIAWRMQLETNYKLIFNPNAIVEHKHRTTYKGLFEQFKKYGIGQVSLYKKYKKIMPLNLFDVLKDTKRIVISVFKFIIKYIFSRKEDKLLVYEPIIYSICLLGLHTGRIIGSFEQKVFYP